MEGKKRQGTASAVPQASKNKRGIQPLWGALQVVRMERGAFRVYRKIL
jgi:hypothetical protein